MPGRSAATGGRDKPRNRASPAVPADEGVPFKDRPDQTALAASRRDILLLLALAAVAFAIRAVPVLLGGGMLGLQGYDDGVYFGAATALVHGVIPYRDFLLLHPPGIVVGLSPLAALGNLTGDPTAFGIARATIMLLGAVNTVLVGLVAGRHDRLAGLTAAALYAVWSTASNFERTTDLHAPQSTLLLLALLALSAHDRVSPRRAGFAGVALGLATTVQLWQAVSVIVVFGWLVLGARKREGDGLRPIVAFAGGAAIAFGLVCLPFLAAAPEAMVRYVLIDQISRPNQGVGIIERLRALEGLPQLVQLPRDLSPADRRPGRGRGGHRWHGDRGDHGVALSLDPPVGGADDRAGGGCPVDARVPQRLRGPRGACRFSRDRYRHRDRLGPHAAAGPMARTGPRRYGRAARAARGHLDSFARRDRRSHLADLESDISRARCITSDAPALLVLTSAMRRNLDAGCATVLDPGGVVYDADRGRLRTDSDVHLPSGTPRDSSRPCWPGIRAAMPPCSRDPRRGCRRRPRPRSRSGCPSSVATASSPCGLRPRRSRYMTAPGELDPYHQVP